MKKRILAALLAASMALCAGCGSQSDDTAEDAQTPSGTAVEVTEVTQGAMSTEYSVNGKVAADNEVQVFPMLAGQVLTLSSAVICCSFEFSIYEEIPQNTIRTASIATTVPLHHIADCQPFARLP